MSSANPLQLLRSNTANKRPDPTALADGRPAVNTNAVSPGLFFKDSAGNLVKVGPVHVGTTAPNASPASGGTAGNSVGEQWLDITGGTYVFKVWDGSAWRSESGTFVDVNGDVMTGALVMDNQQQVRFREVTANGTNYIALQAPASVASDKTITLPDVNGTVVTTGDTGTVTSTMILDGTIVNADVNASAAIAGTKISPDFGPQNVTTTGTSTAASFIPTSSTVPANGVYLPAANQVAVATNSVQRVSFGTSGVVFNDGGEDYDFRIEGDTKTNLLFVDASTGRVGIGTSPLSMLDVQGTEATGERLIIGTRNNDASTNVALDFYTATSSANRARIEVTRNGAFATGDMRFYTQITNTLSEKMRIDYSGRVGIGTVSPGGTLDVKAAASTAPLIVQGPSSEFARIDSSGRLLVGTSSAFDTANTGTSWLVGIEKPSGYSALSLKTNEASANGAYLNLGKSRGTSANSKTIVNNNDEIGGVYFEGADGSAMRVGANISAYVDGTPGASDLPTRLVFSVTRDGQASPTSAMRITNSGRTVVLGNTNAFDAYSEQGAGTSFELFIGGHSATTTAPGSGTTSFRVFTNGNVQNTNNSYGSLSDAKLKENIVDAGSQWNDLKSFQVRKYNFKEETGQQTHTQIGLVAQEVELVSPGLVTESPDRDAEGNDLGTVTKSVNYSVLYMKAVKALQEAMERIETLEAKVAALESA
jgi:hypothetical protein